MYAGNIERQLFVPTLEENIKEIQYRYGKIKKLFEEEGIENFERSPEDPDRRLEFVKLFNEMNRYLQAARLQGFEWNEEIISLDKKKTESSLMLCSQEGYDSLLKRYQEIAKGNPPKEGHIPYDIDSYVMEIDTVAIDDAYIQSKFEKYLEAREKSEDLENAENELHTSFATLSSEEQKYAKVFLSDIYSGKVDIVPGKRFREYLVEYKNKIINDEIHEFAQNLGVDEEKLRTMKKEKVTEYNINEFGRFDELKETVDYGTAEKYLIEIHKKELMRRDVIKEIDRLLREYLID